MYIALSFSLYVSGVWSGVWSETDGSDAAWGVAVYRQASAVCSPLSISTSRSLSLSLTHSLSLFRRHFLSESERERKRERASTRERERERERESESKSIERELFRLWQASPSDQITLERNRVTL